MSEATTYDRWTRGPAGRYATTAPLAWDVGRLGSGWVLTIPPGFAFDSSVPAWARWYFSPDDPRWLLAAAVHDCLLEQGHDRAFAACEWLRAARAMDSRKRVWFAFVGVFLWAFLKPNKKRVTCV
jgi:hypothetical protein